MESKRIWCRTYGSKCLECGVTLTKSNSRPNTRAKRSGLVLGTCRECNNKNKRGGSELSFVRGRTYGSKCVTCKAVLSTANSLKRYDGAAGVILNTCRDCLNKKRRDSIRSNPNLLSKTRERAKQYHRRKYSEYFGVVSSNQGGAFCACCGEDFPGYLTVDHVNNDGYMDKGRTGRRKSEAVFRKTRAGDVGDLQILCMNCNFSKMRNKGVLPAIHEWRMKRGQKSALAPIGAGDVY